MKKPKLTKLLKRTQKKIRQLAFEQEWAEDVLVKKLKITNETHKGWLFDYLYNKSFSTREMIAVLSEEKHV
jgi:hypothetical protein